VRIAKSGASPLVNVTLIFLIRRHPSEEEQGRRRRPNRGIDRRLEVLAALVHFLVARN